MQFVLKNKNTLTWSLPVFLKLHCNCNNCLKLRPTRAFLGAIWSPILFWFVGARWWHKAAWLFVSPIIVVMSVQTMTPILLASMVAHHHRPASSTPPDVADAVGYKPSSPSCFRFWQKWICLLLDINVLMKGSLPQLQGVNVFESSHGLPFLLRRWLVWVSMWLDSGQEGVRISLLAWGWGTPGKGFPSD